MGLDGLSYVARTLQAYSAALDVTGQNLSQMNAPGYTRQRIEPNAGVSPVTGMPPVPVLLDTKSYADNGIERLRNAFLDRAVRVQQTAASGAAATHEMMQQVSNVFDETSVDGLIAISNQLSSAFTQAAQQPSNLQYRQNVLAQADALASTFEGKSAQLQETLDNAGIRTEETVSRINSLLSQLAELNGYIPKPATADVNALLDRRDLLLDDLSKHIDLTVAAQPQGDLVVYGGGVPLMFGKTARTLQVGQDVNGNAIVTTETGRAVPATGGSLGALLELQNKTLPNIIGRLNDLAGTLTEKINQRLANSYDLNGVSGSPLFETRVGAGGVATNREVGFVSLTAATTPGTYDVRITQAATQGQVQGRSLTVAQVAGSGGVAGQTADLGTTIRIQAGAADVTLAIGGNTLSDVISAINGNSSLRNVVTASASGPNLMLTSQTLSTNTADLTVTFTSGTNAFGLDATAPGGVQTSALATAGARARLANTETLSFTNGAGANTQITLTAGTIISTAVTQVNTVLQASGIALTASFGAGTFRLTNDQHGGPTTVGNTVASTLNSSSAANSLGFMAVAGTSATIGDTADAALFHSQAAGQDVAGTISGFAAVGTGQVLTGVDGPSTGLSLRFTGSAPPVGFDAGKITVSNGKPVLTMRRVLDNPSRVAFASGSMRSAAAVTSLSTPLLTSASIASESPKLNVPLSTVSGTLLVNGEQVNWDGGESLDEVLAKLPGVKASFDTETQTVRLMRDPAYGTSGPAIIVSDVTGNLAAALGLDTATVDNGVPGDSSTAQRLIDVINGAEVPVAMPRQGVEGLRGLQADVATDTSLSRSAQSTSERVLSALESQRQQDGGVNADEEALNLIQYQRAYESAVQLAKAQDSLLTTLIDMVSSR